MTTADKTALITGATDGLGRAVALVLAWPGMRLILHGRDEKRGAEVVKAAMGKGAEARFERADLSSLADVQRFGHDIARSETALHLLINNAGIGFGPPLQKRQIGADGHELRFTVNYLAPVLLTDILMPVLRAAAPARIVNVASAGQHPIEFDNLMLERGYSGSRAYRQAKLAMIMWTFDLAEKLKRDGIAVNALHPATFMNTTMVRQGWGVPMSKVSTGVKAVLNLASVVPDDMTGVYFDGLKTAQPDRQAFDAPARARLRQATEQLLASFQTNM